MAGIPLVSIGIPTYNRANDVGRAIKSAMSQDYENLEIIVSDNCSSDNTEQLCQTLSAQDGRIRYLRQPTNRGATENFRIVLRAARGEFFMWLGDDDWLAPNYVSRCADVLTIDGSYSLAYGLDRYFKKMVLDCEGNRIELEQEARQDRVVAYFDTVSRNGMFYGLMRRDLISKISIAEIIGADWLMIAAMAYLGKIKMVDDSCVNRSIAGHSSDWSTLAAAFNLSEFQRSNPYLAIASNVFVEIGWRSSVYNGLGRAGRLRLATRACRAVLRRHYSGRQVIALGRQILSLSMARWRRGN